MSGRVSLPLPSEAPASESPASEPMVEIPFGCGSAFPVSQTNDHGCHVQNDTWAWDFRMPVGTPVAAARDGDGADGARRLDPRGRDPALRKRCELRRHRWPPTAYETQYLHFSKVLVKAGDR